MALDLSLYHALTFYPRGQDYTGPAITHNCNMPWTSLSVNLEGRCFVCGCDAHLPIPVGVITDFDKLEDVWLSPAAQELQQTITERKFTYCAIDHCGIKTQDILTQYYYISVNIDESCNLACPTCRRSLINHTSGPIFDTRKAQVDHFVDLINNFDKPLYLTMTGNGDPLASLIMRPLVLNWVPKANQTIQLFTNGLLMRKLLPESTIFPYIRDFKISVDAGSKDVYEVVRKPGKFSILRENLDWLASNREPNTQVRLMFTLSALNALDIVNFAEMCNNYGFNGEITKLDNWNTFDNFDENNVIDNLHHPLYTKAVEQLRLISKMPNIALAPTIRNII